MQVGHWRASTDGPLSAPGLRRKLEAMGYEVSHYTYPPGTVFPPHDHAEDKIDAVLAGRFRLSMEGASVILEAGDWLLVPAGVEHMAEVVGDEAVISLDGVKREHP